MGVRTRLRFAAAPPAVAAALGGTVLARDGDRVAAGLLAPYPAWSGFATALTARVSDPRR